MPKRARAALSMAVGVLLAAGCSGGSHSATPPSGSATTASASIPPTASAPTSPAPAGYPNWPTYHGDAARTGVSSAMPAVGANQTVIASVALDAAVYASPIVVNRVIVVATENDSLYGVSAKGRIVWRRNLGKPVPLRDLPCGNINPSGITGTPVYDATTKLVYVVAELAAPVRHELVALSPGTGRVRWTRSLGLGGTSQDAMQQRGALTIASGRVWAPFGGRNGDCGRYRGKLVGIPATGKGATITYTVPTTREGGIWAAPGPSVSADGHLYVSVGNGASGLGGNYDHTDSVLELDGSARLVDSFSPSTWARDNSADLDLGSQGPALVGPWIFSVGKSGTAYVLRQGALGGIGGQVSSGELCTSYGGTAVDAGVVYVPCSDGLRAVRIDDAGRMQPLWHAALSIAGSPVVGGGRVWALDQDAGVLYALDPATGAARSHVAVGVTSRFATPALYGRDVLVPTMHGLTIVATS